MSRWLGTITGLLERLIPAEMAADPEQGRRARLVANFGILGSIFGFVYCLFYILIGHQWGALIIVLCSSCYLASPFIMRRQRRTETAAQLQIFTLTCGFTSLCFVEGGLQGHAIAWLISVPLCAFLLLGEKQAIRWASVAFLAAGVVAGLDLDGVQFAVTYDPRWQSVVSTAGYMGLIVFLFILGFIFERGRARAFAKMQEALADLAKTNERLVHLNQEKNEFLGIAAHDLKNPLTAIMGNAQLAEMAPDPRVATRLLRNISDAANRMRGLIANLLDINAIEQQGLKLNLEACKVHALIQQTLENNELAASKKEIEVRVGASADFYATADRNAVLQVLDNLVSNALKYSLPKSNVQIHVLREGNQVLVAVRDQGPGISESDQKKLFRKFTRLSARPTAGESSTGLGLAIVKRLAEAMSGNIQCTSTPGAGSTFTLSLPLAATPPPAPRAVTPITKELPNRTIISEKIYFSHGPN